LESGKNKKTECSSNQTAANANWFQLLAMLFKTPMPLARQLESSPSSEVHLFSPSAVSWLITTNFIPLAAHLVRQSHKHPIHRGGQHTQMKQQKERFRCAENGSQAHGCRCFHAQLEATTRPGRKITLF